MATKKQKVNSMSIALEQGTDNTLVCTWNYNKGKSKKYFDYYNVIWKYRATAGGTVYSESATTISSQSTHYSKYSYPSNAYQVYCYVKPVSKTYKKKGSNKTHHRWASDYAHASKLIKKIDVPGDIGSIDSSVVNNKIRLSIEVDNAEINTGTNQVKIQVMTNGNIKSLLYNATVNIVNNYVRIETKEMTAGCYYQWRACGYNSTSKKAGSWSNWSDKLYAAPAKPFWVGLSANDQQHVRLDFTVQGKINSYNIEYAAKKEYFDDYDSSTDIQSQTISEKNPDDTSKRDVSILLGGIQFGSTWFFRITAIGDDSVESVKSEVKGLDFGKAPAAPTTWSDVNSIELGKKVNLYWTHNSQDGSSQTYANLEVYVGDGTNQRLVIEENIKNEYTDESDKDKNGHYELDVSSEDFYDSCYITWRVQTAGIYTENDELIYGDWSVVRTIRAYEPPTVTLTAPSTSWLWDPFNFVDDPETGELEDRTDVIYENTIGQYPVNFDVVATPSTQRPLSYQLEITALDPYIITTIEGNDVEVQEGQVIFSKIYKQQDLEWTLSIGPDEIYLYDGAHYSAHITVYMDSGLTAEDTVESIEVMFYDSDISESIDAGLVLDNDSLYALITPVCWNDDETDYRKNILLDVYRIESNGIRKEDSEIYTTTLTLIASDIPNNGTSIVDPHPSLSNQRYRIVAKNNMYGQYSVADISPDEDEYFDYQGIVIQWNETWTTSPLIFTDEDNADSEYAEALESDDTWNGFMIKLKGNVDIQETYNPDVSLINYIGRESPVSYYGTQKGIEGSWSCNIPKEDTDTLYALRALALYMGDVYVREPSGIGYWANINVSMSQTHREVLVPVSFTIKRVEGGI